MRERRRIKTAGVIFLVTLFPVAAEAGIVRCIMACASCLINDRDDACAICFNECDDYPPSNSASEAAMLSASPWLQEIDACVSAPTDLMACINESLLPAPSGQDWNATISDNLMLSVENSGQHGADTALIYAFSDGFELPVEMSVAEIPQGDTSAFDLVFLAPDGCEPISVDVFSANGPSLDGGGSDFDLGHTPIFAEDFEAGDLSSWSEAQ